MSKFHPLTIILWNKSTCVEDADTKIRAWLEEAGKKIQSSMHTSWKEEPFYTRLGEALGLSQATEPECQHEFSYRGPCNKCGYIREDKPKPQDGNVRQISGTEIIGALSLTRHIKSDIERGNEMHKLLFPSKEQSEREKLIQAFVKVFRRNNSYMSNLLLEELADAVIAHFKFKGVE